MHNALINASVQQVYLYRRMPSANDYTYHQCDHCRSCHQTII